MTSNRQFSQPSLIIQATQPNIYLCYYYRSHRGYQKNWLNNYDILGIQPGSHYLFNTRQIRKYQHYLAKRKLKPQAQIISLVDARVKAGKQIQHDMK